jgi:hypothetical protein
LIEEFRKKTDVLLSHRNYHGNCAHALATKKINWKL